MKTITNLLFQSLILVNLILVSCNSNSIELEKAFTLAGKNSIELQKVLDHYSQEPGDSLKIKAATFLIANMAKHSIVTGRHRNEYDFVFDSLDVIPRIEIDKRKEVFAHLVDSLNSYFRFSDQIRVQDITSIDANFLIENIDYAFKAWQEMPLPLIKDFNEFLEYVLPYRTGNEILEPGRRKALFNGYKWVFDSLRQGQPLEDILVEIMLSKQFIYWHVKYNYPYSHSLTQLEKKGFGTCFEFSSYWIQTFRAIGIPTTYESVPHWGHHHSSGHDWLAIKTGDDFKTTDPVSPKFDDFAKKLHDVNAPKVYRQLFSSDRLDVTDLYRNTTEVEIDFVLNKDNDFSEVSLCVFDRPKTWFAVATSKRARGKVKFTKIGRDCVYIIGYYKQEQFIPLSYPFLINSKNERVDFKPSTNTHNGVMTAKYPPFSPLTAHKKLWKTNLNGGKILAANKADFSDAVELLEIKKISSFQPLLIPLRKTGKSYLHYKFIAAKDHISYIAELDFYDANGNELKGKVTGKPSSDSLCNEYLTYGRDETLVYDNILFSWYGGCSYEVGLSFEQPQKIAYIIIQARNDGNQIIVGEKYELMYWDQQWVSLGKKEAKDTLLAYQNIPKNALYWVRNLTEGKEEHVFSLDDSGTQVWPGMNW